MLPTPNKIQQPRNIIRMLNNQFNYRSRKRKREKKEKYPKPTAGTGSDSGAESAGLSDSDSEVEDKYEKEQAERPAKKMRPLLPIKTKEGLMERAEECEGNLLLRFIFLCKSCCTK